MHVPSLSANGCARLLLESFNSPDSSDAETAKAGFYFGADLVQWRACLRRMARARLLRVLHSNTGSQRLVSGAFAVAKDHRDKFIGDRRRQNEKERLIHRACLPYAPRLKRVLLKNGYSLRLNLRDVRDCFLPLSSGRQAPQETDHRASGARKLVQ